MGLETLIDKNELRYAVSLINKFKIPSPTQLVVDLKNELSLSQPNEKKIIELISQDIGLSSEVIKTLNSPFYNLKTEVTSLEYAIKLFGLEKLKDIIVQPAYRRALNVSLKGFESISKRSHDIGLVAEIIANEISSNQQGMFYMAGLFHDVGVIILAQNDPAYTELRYERTLRPITLVCLEKERYNVTHPAIGVLLAKKWGLSNIVCNAIYLHHHVYSTYRKQLDIESITMVSVLIVAIYLYNKNSSGLDVKNSVECALLYQNALEELMLDESAIDTIEDEIKYSVL